MAIQIRKSSVLQVLNLTPLIDVVFLLLIFFLVATQFAEEDRELNVKLPTASAAKPLIMKPNDLEVSIDAQGNYFLGTGQKLTADEMRAALGDAAVNNPLRQSVIIRADRNCPWNAVAQAMNYCYQAGLRDVKTSVSGAQ